jgi:thiamine phosphate synthase YjbQ (UPF0047 family)
MGFYSIDILNISNLQQGLINVFISGSTGAITAIEFEPGILDVARDRSVEVNLIGEK